MNITERALIAASLAHAGINQRRKYTFEPYHAHCVAVANLVRSVPHTDEMVAAAYLHDVVEDTPTTLEDVQSSFGAKIANLVYWLTDEKHEGLNRAARNAITIERYSRAPVAAQTIKLADLIDNTKSIREFDPGFWKVYQKEKQALLEVLDLGNPILLAQAKEQVQS